MNLITDSVLELFTSFLQEIKVDIDLTSNREMADMYEVGVNDIVCLDGGVYLVRVQSTENNKEAIKFVVDKEVHHCATYWEPSDVDVSNVVTTYSFNEAVSKAIDTILNDRIVNASMNLVPWEEEPDYDIGDAYS